MKALQISLVILCLALAAKSCSAAEAWSVEMRRVTPQHTNDVFQYQCPTIRCVYDLVKAGERFPEISCIRVLWKGGGWIGFWTRDLMIDERKA